MLLRVLVIGYGSDLRGDDALGPRAAEALEARYEGVEGVKVLGRASLTPDLAEDAAGAELVIFVDCDAELGAGVIRRREVEELDESTAAMVHFLDPAALLYWSSHLFGAQPRGVIYGVGGATFECADGLSEVVAGVFDDLIDRVTGEVDGALGAREVAGA